MSSTAAAPIKSRAEALKSAFSAPAGGTETIAFTPTTSGWYGLIIVNESGGGTYTLQRI